MAESFTLIGNLKLDPTSINQSARQVKQALGRITGQASEFQKSLDASTARVFAFGATTAVLNGVSQAFQALVRSTIEVQARLTEINAIFQQSESVMNSFREVIFDVAQETGQTFSTVADAAAELARQGLSAEETAQRLQAALILTRISGLGAEDSVKTLTAAINGFTSAALTAEEVTSKIVAVDTAFAVSAQDLAQGLARAGSTAEDAGVSFDELLGLITAVEQRTARGGAVIGNAFKSIFTRLSRGSTIEDLQALGVEIDASQTGVEKLKALSNALQNIADPTVASKIKELAGGVFQINVVSATLKDLANETGVFKKATEEAAQASDNAFKRNAELNKSLSAQINSLVVGLTNLAEKIGGVTFGPLLENLVSIADKVTEFFNKALDPEKGNSIIKAFIKGIGLFISGPGLVIITAAFLKIVRLVGKFAIDGFKALQQIGTAAEQIQQVEGGIVSLLSRDEKLRKAIASTTLTQAQKEEAVISAIKRENQLLNEQKQILKSITNLAVQRGFTGFSSSGGFKRSRRAAGYIPNFAIRDEFAAEENEARLLGATKSVRAKKGKGTIGGRKFIMNDQETEIPNFGKNGDSAVIPNYSMGYVPNFAKDIHQKVILAADGYIPNFAASPKASLIASKRTSVGSLSDKYPTAKRSADRANDRFKKGRATVVNKNKKPTTLKAPKNKNQKLIQRADKITSPNIDVYSLGSDFKGLLKRKDDGFKKAREATSDIEKLVNAKYGGSLNDEIAEYKSNSALDVLGKDLAVEVKAGGFNKQKVIEKFQRFPLENATNPREAVGGLFTDFSKRVDDVKYKATTKARLITGDKQTTAKIEKEAKKGTLKRSPSLAEGYIPNFARAFNPSVDDNFIKSKADFELFTKKDKDPFYPYKTKKVYEERGNPTLQKRLATWKEKVNQEVIDVGKISGGSLPSVLTPAGFSQLLTTEKTATKQLKQLRFKFPVKPVDENSTKEVAINFKEKFDPKTIEKKAIDSAITQANVITSALGQPKQTVKDIDKKSVNGFVGAVRAGAGAVFEAAVSSALRLKAGARGEGADFDVRNNGGNLTGLVKLFGSKPTPSKGLFTGIGDFKFSQDAQDSMKEKTLKELRTKYPDVYENLEKENPKKQPIRKKPKKQPAAKIRKATGYIPNFELREKPLSEALNKETVISLPQAKAQKEEREEKTKGFKGVFARGFIPNFALPKKAASFNEGGALGDAIKREKDAGLPKSKIRVEQSQKLVNSGNPAGLAVTNTRDEPRGLKDVFASGYVPNFAQKKEVTLEEFKNKSETEAKTKLLYNLKKRVIKVESEIEILKRLPDKDIASNQVLNNNFVSGNANNKVQAVSSFASGYVPNFTGRGPLGDAIKREKDAGLPQSKIRVEQSQRLANRDNPSGLAVTNTRDEPRGLKDVFASGYVPNYATPPPLPAKGLNLFAKTVSGLTNNIATFAGLSFLNTKAIEAGTAQREAEKKVATEKTEAKVKEAEQAAEKEKQGKTEEEQVKIDESLAKTLKDLQTELDTQTDKIDASTTAYEKFTGALYAANFALGTFSEVYKQVGKGFGGRLLKSGKKFFAGLITKAGPFFGKLAPLFTKIAGPALAKLGGGAAVKGAAVAAGGTLATAGVGVVIGTSVAAGIKKIGLGNIIKKSFAGLVIEGTFGKGTIDGVTEKLGISEIFESGKQREARLAKEGVNRDFRRDSTARGAQKDTLRGFESSGLDFGSSNVIIQEDILKNLKNTGGSKERIAEQEDTLKRAQEEAAKKLANYAGGIDEAKRINSASNKIAEDYAKAVRAASETIPDYGEGFTGTFNKAINKIGLGGDPILRDDEGALKEAEDKKDADIEKLKASIEVVKLEKEIKGIKQQELAVQSKIFTERQKIAANIGKEAAIQQSIINTRQNSLKDFNRAASLVSKDVLKSGGTERIAFGREKLKIKNSGAEAAEATFKRREADAAVNKFKDKTDGGGILSAQEQKDYSAATAAQSKAQLDVVKATNDYINAIQDGTTRMQSSLNSIADKIKAGGEDSITKAFKEVESISQNSIKNDKSKADRDISALRLAESAKKVEAAITSSAQRKEKENASASAKTFGNIASQISGGDIELEIEKYKAGVQALRDPNLSNEKKLEISGQVTKSQENIEGTLGTGAIDVLNKQLGQTQDQVKDIQLKTLQKWATTLEGFSREDQKKIVESIAAKGTKNEPNKNIAQNEEQQQALLQSYLDLNGELAKFTENTKNINKVDILKKAQELETSLENAAKGPKQLEDSLNNLASFGEGANLAIETAQKNIELISKSSQSAENQITNLNIKLGELAENIAARVARLEQLIKK